MPKGRDAKSPVDDPFRELPLAQQRALVARIARRRARHLRDRYPDIAAVWTGNRSRGDRVTTEPSLVFVVDAKRPESELDPAAMLPRAMVAYVGIGGKRRRVLVPTDVVGKASFGGATPDADPSPVEVLIPGQSLREGQVCCAVRRTQGPKSPIAISCRHVLTSDADLATGGFSDARLFLVNDAPDAPHVAVATTRGGRLVDGSASGPFSFDAQLASVNPDAHDRLRAALGIDLVPDWPASSGDLVFNDAWIHTRRGPIAARLLACGPSVEPITYGTIRAFHEELITFELRESGRTQRGDSGAPVTTERTGGRLVGMHIASDSDTQPQKTYAIPAWRLLRPRSYPGGTAQEAWELVPAADLPELERPQEPPAAVAPGAPLAWGSKVSPVFRQRVRDICAGLGTDPSWLMAAMAFETGGTFSPSITNPISGATGLIQFMPATAQGLGTSTAQLATMSAEQQLEFVGRYFAPFAGRLRSLEDLYMAILWPEAVGIPVGSPIFIRDDPRTGQAYAQNQGLDLDRDGRVLKSEAAAKVVARLNDGRRPENLA